MKLNVLNITMQLDKGSQLSSWGGGTGCVLERLGPGTL